MATDLDTGEWATTEADSGGKPFGEHIPDGDWEILDQARNPDSFRLDAVEIDPYNDRHEPSGRDKFRLHGPGNTTGCIACNEGWESVRDLISRTQTSTVQDQAAPWWKPFAEPTPIKKFGTLRVQP